MNPQDIVRLKGTNAVYRIRALYSTYPLHKDRESLSQVWAVLVKKGGVLAYWPVNQLELVQKYEQA